MMPRRPKCAGFDLGKLSTHLNKPINSHGCALIDPIYPTIERAWLPGHIGYGPPCTQLQHDPARFYILAMDSHLISHSPSYPMDWPKTTSWYGPPWTWQDPNPFNYAKELVANFLGMPIVATKHPNAFKEHVMESASKRIVKIEMHLLLERRALIIFTHDKSSFKSIKIKYIGVSNLSKSNTLVSQIYPLQLNGSLHYYSKSLPFT